MNERIDFTTTLVEVAHLYYEENLSQQEIASRLNVSRSLIALYIKKAREKGIVSIKIIDPLNDLAQIATQLSEKYQLKFVKVIPSAHNSPPLTRRALGNAVANYLDEYLEDKDVLGLGWGRTIMEIASLVAPAKPRRVDVVPLLGESGYTGTYSQLNQIVLQVARSFGGSPYFLLAPVLVGTPDLRDSLLHDEVARQVVERWNRLDVVCVGIGVIPPVEGQIVYVGEENVPKLVQQDIVGDICARYFNQKGNFIIDQYNDRLLGVGLNQLRKTRTVIAVAEGAEKANATLGALRTQLISNLFIDETLAHILLAEPI